ncbi:MAG: helix-turn-helix transcriptional regulator [Bradyrhizobium sp.]|nr:helix-turn-helix transcriptional regulator [Bradyrhizobium sp.]
MDDIVHPLRHYRKTNNISLKEMAELVGTSEQSISRIETGKQEPSVSMIIDLSRATKNTIPPATFLDFAIATRKKRRGTGSSAGSKKERAA